MAQRAKSPMKSCVLMTDFIPSGYGSGATTELRSVEVADLVRSPELSELRTFCVAAEAGSLGRAALRLNVSQPALTKRLQNLERLVGVELLERSPRGVKLTPPGRRLYEAARRLLEQATEVEDGMVRLRRAAGPLRLPAAP